MKRGEEQSEHSQKLLDETFAITPFLMPERLCLKTNLKLGMSFALH